MTSARFTILLFIAAVSSSSKIIKDTDVGGKKIRDVPVSVDSRFFDMGPIFGQSFPIYNQANLGGTGNPSVISFPGSTQFYPGITQGQFYPLPSAQGSRRPIIDDAKQYPTQGKNQGNFLGSQQPQTQYPNQVNFGGSLVQYPNPGTFGGSLPNQYPNPGNFGGFQNQFPNQGGFGGSVQNQYPNQGNVGGWQQTQYPNQGNLGGWQQTQYPNQGNFGGSPPTQFPNQGNFGGSPPCQYPNEGSFGRPQNSNQGGSLNQDNQNNSGNDGTLNGITPQDNQPGQFFNNSNQNQRPSQNQRPTENQQPNGNGRDVQTAGILGNPVAVPTSTTPAGQIVFPSSTESPSRRQCVQDCQTTSEYSPVCGTNNVTYFNPGRFICARNCGIDVYVLKQGRCGADTPSPRNVAKIKT